MTPKTGFDSALARAKHLLRLYELICDTRQRGVRADWAAAFKEVMHWPAGEQVVRVDGKDRQSVLVFREQCGIDREHFAHEYLSELLRSSVVASISALDRLMHDLVVQNAWKLLSKKESEVPGKLKALSLTAFDARKALEHLRKDPHSRPGNLIKVAIQEKLHRDYTFQTPDSVLLASQMLGIEDFWTKVAAKMYGNPPKQDVIKMLSTIAKRRNQIVHEADLIRTSRHQPSLREIAFAHADEWVNWMDAFGSAINTVVQEHV